MKINPDDNSEQLGRSLREWRVIAPLPPQFEEQVWRRIAATEDQPFPWTNFRNWFQLAFARPAVALAYALVLLSLGSGAGYWKAREKSARIEQSLGSRYVHSVDPYQKTGM